MSDFERNRIDFQLRSFTQRNFEQPSACKNVDQIQFYISELSQKIQHLEVSIGYVPDWVYTLLAQYNARQNSMLQTVFKTSYR
jgi:hypothetical protein